MTLTALDATDRTVISPEDIRRRSGLLRSQVVSQLRLRRFFCPHCAMLGRGDIQVILVDAQSKRLHFRHKATESASDRCAGYKGEDHINIQVEFAQWLENQEEGIATLEKSLPEIGRIADIYLERPDGTAAVYEVQLAHTTSDKLEERTKDYKSLGLDVYWMLGKGALKSENIQWCHDTLGGFIELMRESGDREAAA